MKILFLTSPKEDYLADSILHGFKELYKAECVDYPRADILYKDFIDKKNIKIYGNGFTLYTGLLDEDYTNRFDIEKKIIENYYDIIIVSNIWRQFGMLYQFRPWLNGNNTIIIDGEDSPMGYPASGKFIRNSCYWVTPRVDDKFIYFKREWTEITVFNVVFKYLPKIIKKLTTRKSNLRKIGFSIPSEKIIKDSVLEKKKLFSRHIVDEEVAKMISQSSTKYAFENEEDYYKDLQESKYGVTTKRSGWDCLRHYEIAANGCVPCFKNLDLKPRNCAPHGLNNTNSISYKSANELIEKIEKISDEEYIMLRTGALDWARENTTIKIARNVINDFLKFKDEIIVKS